ncbi:MAG: hypothetical protein KKB50_16935 [Planctomycetes bacterium]|nr:hypothetical protein [Planctomycetota bacterium]
MTETSHARSRRASLFGLILQFLAFAGVLGLSFSVHSTAVLHLSWYLLGGVPIWFIALLVFRQRELAELEAMDLEELRREKQASGGGAAIFDKEGGGGLGYMVAENRLRWMQRWLVPGFGLLTAAYLIGMGFWRWRMLVRGVDEVGWPQLINVPMALITLAIVMLLLFLFSRFASGMGRVPEWQLLRACGSYMLGTAVAALVLIVSLGVQLYASVATWEHALSYVIPGLMMLLGVEAVLNYVLDIYRPRTPDAEPRACFDSRLLGLIAEPGGIAHTIAEALNYQFGFQVSQTWFYQLLQRSLIPLAAVGLCTLWLLTCIVVVQPYETCIIERLGKQLNADTPMGSGLHWKLPWPISRARMYNTGQLHQIIVGLQTDAAPKRPEGETEVWLWTDPRHRGYEHFDFLIAPTPDTESEREVVAAEDEDESGRAAPMHIFRMHAAIQYRILPKKLAAFTNRFSDAHRALRDIAWEEQVRFNAATYADRLLGEQREAVGRILQERISKRVREQDLGLEVVYVGLQNLHPERTVSEAFRRVVTAEQEKVAAIRKARVTENEILSRVAGQKRKARRLANALEKARDYETTLNQAENVLRRGQSQLDEQMRTSLLEFRPQFLAKVETDWKRDEAYDMYMLDKDEFDLGMGGSVRQVTAMEERYREAEAQAETATQALEAALQPLREQELRQLDPVRAQALIERVEAQTGLEYWNRRLEELFVGLEGEAAVVLAQAQARRWETEMKADGEVARLRNERDAYKVAPAIYKARRYLQVLVDGIKDSRKYFLAFDPGERAVHIRLETQEQARPDDEAMPTRMEP